MSKPTVGFTVIYRWRLHPGQEALFREHWARNSQEFIRRCGALGSRLHQADDGTWVAYAQWPDRETWAASPSPQTWDPEGAARMAAVVAERFEPVLMAPVEDFLLPATLK